MILILVGGGPPMAKTHSIGIVGFRAGLQ